MNKFESDSRQRYGFHLKVTYRIPLESFCIRYQNVALILFNILDSGLHISGDGTYLGTTEKLEGYQVEYSY